MPRICDFFEKTFIDFANFYPFIFNLKEKRKYQLK